MSQPVHGYLRFCFELSEYAHRNGGLEPKLPVTRAYLDLAEDVSGNLLRS
jgi:hypothetical protein